MPKFAFTLSEVRVLVDAPDQIEAWNQVDELQGTVIATDPANANPPRAVLLRGWVGMATPVKACVVCGCTADDPCEAGCGWLTANLCDTLDEAHIAIYPSQGIEYADGLVTVPEPQE